MGEHRFRVLHIATLVTPDGAYGGPVRVATNQVKALRDRGHDAVLAAGVSGFDEIPDEWDGAPTALFPARRAVPTHGFAATSAPGMLRWIRRHASRFDVAHVHLARDLVTLPAALTWMRTGKPFVTQTHGMVVPSSRRLAAPLDAVATRRVLARAHAGFYLTEQERRGLLDVARGTARLVPLVNGVPCPPEPEPPTRHPEVLYLARLHPRKRPADFVRAAATLAPEFPEARFTLIGPDEGEGKLVAEMIRRLPAEARSRVRWAGSIPPDAVPTRLARCAVYVLPSRDEPFPMSVLEAMAGARPVVVTESNGLADAITSSGAGAVVCDQDQLAAQLRRILEDSNLRQEMGNLGRQLVADRFAMGAVVADLEKEYTAALRQR